MSVGRLLKDPLIELQLEGDVLLEDELEEGVEKEVEEKERI